MRAAGRGAAIDFQLLEHRKMSREDAVARMRGQTDEYDPRVLSALEYVIEDEFLDYQLEHLMLADLVSGMIITEALLSDEDVMLLSSGQLLTTHALTRLRNWPTVRADRRVPVLVPRRHEGLAMKTKASA